MAVGCISTSIGNLYISEEEGKIIEIGIKKKELTETTSLIEEVKKQLMEYFEKKRTAFDFPYEEKGTDFQKQVWKAMREIPYGQVRTYGWIAQRIGNPKAVRAVGGACHHNPILLSNPCHRVVAANHQLGGFGCGVENKKILLNLEGAKL